MDSNQVIEIARSYLGTPFHHQGRVKGVGVDCLGLVICVAQELGIIDENPKEARDYARTPFRGRLEAGMESYLTRSRTPEPGCVLLISFINEPMHVAIYAGDTIIHAYSAIGKCVEHRYDDKWRRRTTCSYLWPKE